MRGSNGIDKSTMVDAAFWRVLLDTAKDRGGIRAISFGDGSLVAYEPTLQPGTIAVPGDLIEGPPGMARGGPQVYQFGSTPRALPDAPGATGAPRRTTDPTPIRPAALRASPIPEIKDMDLSVPLVRRVGREK